MFKWFQIHYYQRNILKRSAALSLHFILFVLRRVAVRSSGAMMTKQQLYYLHRVMSQTVATSTNKWIQKLTERKWPYMTENPSYDKFRKIPNISRYKHFAFSARNPGRVSLPEFPTSATFYVTILSKSKSCPMSNQSMTWTVSLFYLPVCQMSAPGIWLFVRTNIPKKYDEDARDVTCPKPLTQITKSKDMLVHMTMTNPMQRKGRRKHEKYFMKYLWQKY